MRSVVVGYWRLVGKGDGLRVYKAIVGAASCPRRYQGGRWRRVYGPEPNVENEIAAYGCVGHDGYCYFTPPWLFPILTDSSFTLAGSRLAAYPGEILFSSSTEAMKDDQMVTTMAMRGVSMQSV